MLNFSVHQISEKSKLPFNEEHEFSVSVSRTNNTFWFWENLLVPVHHVSGLARLGSLSLKLKESKSQNLHHHSDPTKPTG